MSIATRTGDEGQTGLMYGKRVPKDDARVEAYGTIDELNAALGLARTTASDTMVAGQILLIQQDLVALMGELAVAEIDREKYASSDHPKVDDAMLARIDQCIARIEAENVRFDGWATPGGTLHAAALDLARTVCRRAERRVFTLSCEASNVRPLTLKYLNRLSDCLWLLARREETSAKTA